MSRSSQQYDPHQRREDVSESSVPGRYHVHCTMCGMHRMTVNADALPPAGVCDYCRGRRPKYYWARDWESSSD